MGIQVQNYLNDHFKEEIISAIKDQLGAHQQDMKSMFNLRIAGFTKTLHDTQALLEKKIDDSMQVIDNKMELRHLELLTKID